MAEEDTIQLSMQLQLLLGEAHTSTGSTGAIVSFLQVHSSDLKRIVQCGDGATMLELSAVYACNVDLVLTLLAAGAVPAVGVDLYSNLLCNASLFDLNGDVLDDAAIARRLVSMRDEYGLRLPRSEFMSDATSYCAQFDRLECLRVMLEVDPQSGGYTQHDHYSLLHSAARRCKRRIVHYLLESGWTLDGLDLNSRGLSPLGCSMMQFLDTADAAARICDTLDALLSSHVHAAPLVLASGLCDLDMPGNVMGLDRLDLAVLVRMHVAVCAAVRCHSGLPRRVLGSNYNACFVLRVDTDAVDGSLFPFRTLPLDEHVAAVYLPDPLRLCGTVMLPLVRDDTQTMEAVPQRALHFAATVDVLCQVEQVLHADLEAQRWVRNGCMHVLHHSGICIVTCVSPTLRHWAWMRRRHAVYLARR